MSLYAWMLATAWGPSRKRVTGFSAARDLAEKVIDQCGRNDLMNVVAFSSRENVLFETGTRNKRVVKSALDGLNVTQEGTAIGRAIETASRLVSDSHMTLGEIYVISDFREDGDTLRIPDLPDNTRLMLLPVYRESI